MATKNVDAAPLATFRILFGVMMFISMFRFWANGWIEKLYLEPSFHFKYFGFEWVTVPEPLLCYLLFTLCGLSALAVAVGFHYRLNITLFFLSFTYIELMDKTTYLNHYYFISVLSFLMIFLPLHRYFSWDSRRENSTHVPAYTINSIKLLLAIVYIYAGLAKLNPDWLLSAMPLAIWLPSKYNLPILGDLMHQSWVHYLFSWAGALYDLIIVFLLMLPATRVLAFISVIVFHSLTALLFPIGMFPYIMIVSTLIFFSAETHQKILAPLKRLTGFTNEIGASKFTPSRLLPYILTLFFTVQILVPLRFLAYPGNLFWTEQGYRFSWRVMLMEKAGYAQFRIVDGETGKSFTVDNGDFLTSFQEKQMSTQPDFILEYAQFLGEHFEKQGHENLEIYVDSFVALNGRRSQPYVNPNVDLLTIKNNWAHRDWLLSYND